MVYSFTAHNNAIHSNNARTIIEFTKQSVTGWDNDLPQLSWTSNVVHADNFVIGAPVITKGGELMAGEIITMATAIEASNRVFDLTNQTRMSDVLSFNPYNEVLHVRVAYTPNITTYANQWEYGVVDFNSITINMENHNDRDTWTAKLDISDAIKTLDKISVTAWMDRFLTMDEYGVSATNTYLSTLTSTTSYEARGRVKVDSIYVYDYENNFVSWINQPQGAQGLTYIKIADIFQAVSDSLGLEGQINNGQSWSTCITTRWIVNTVDYVGGGTGANLLNYLTFDQLYILASWFYLGEYHNNNWTLLDYQKLGAGALTTKGSMLEALKFLCVSLGLQMRIDINSSGKRYLVVEEFGRTFDVFKTNMIDNTLIGQSIEMVPYPETSEGIQVNTAFESSYTLGNIGNDYINLDTCFVAGQNIALKYLREDSFSPVSALVGYGWWNKSTTPYTCAIDRGDKEFFQTLFGSMDTPSGKYVTDMYTICAVRPYRNTIPIPASATGDGLYSYAGVFDGTGMQFPNYSSGFNSFEDIHSYWLASYYYSIASYEDDPIGATRRYNREIVINYPSILATNAARVGQEVDLTIAGVAHTWVIKEIEIDLSNYTSKITLRSRDYTL